MSYYKYLLTYSLIIFISNYSFSERYASLVVKTEDTDPMTHNEAVEYLKSPACQSTNSIKISSDEIAYVFTSTSAPRPNTTPPQYTRFDHISVATVLIDYEDLESDAVLGFNLERLGGSTAANNISSNAPICGPCTIKIVLQPRSKRQSWNTVGTGSNEWSNSRQNNWDFQGSEGKVIFRIIGGGGNSSSNNQLPSQNYVTVIPENSPTDVRIVLEQSTDLINWTSANQGVFSPSTSRRFFRVRAEEE